MPLSAYPVPILGCPVPVPVYPAPISGCPRFGVLDAHLGAPSATPMPHPVPRRCHAGASAALSPQGDIRVLRAVPDRGVRGAGDAGAVPGAHLRRVLPAAGHGPALQPGHAADHRHGAAGHRGLHGPLGRALQRRGTHQPRGGAGTAGTWGIWGGMGTWGGTGTWGIWGGTGTWGHRVAQGHGGCGVAQRPGMAQGHGAHGLAQGHRDMEWHRDMGYAGWHRDM